MKRLRGHHTVFLVWGAGAATAAASFAIIGRIRFDVWIIFAIWALVLMPAILYALRSGGSDGQIRVRFPRLTIAFYMTTLLFVACLLNLHFSPVTLIPDETAYRFQARVLASGRLMAETPPGALGESETPLPLRYNHHIYQPSGWFTKYPIGFPLVLAVGQLAQAEWLVNPMLGTLLFLLIAMIAGNVFDPPSAVLAAILTLLSPYFLGNVIGWMAHPLCGLLVAAAFYAAFRGIDAKRLSYFVLMLALLTLAAQVRPFTAFLSAIVLLPFTIWAVRGHRHLVRGLIVSSAVFAALTVAALLLYNWAFTGEPLLSPYALYSRGSELRELDLSLVRWASRLVGTNFRWQVQGTLLTTAPFLILWAAYGAWRFRSNPKVLPLAAIFPVLVVGYSFNPIATGSEIGERFWLEGFFGIAVLGSAAVLSILRQYRTSRSVRTAVLSVLILTQLALSVRVFVLLDSRTHGYAGVTSLARSFSNCRCAVFLDLDPPVYNGQHLNLNDADWASANVFYLIDPGPAEREEWARKFSYSEWKVITYDADADLIGLIDSSGGPR